MTFDWGDYSGVLFDLDGVITPTAEVHKHAWGRMFDEFLAARSVDRRFSEQDYFDYVDGKPRYDGVRSFLASRGIELPDGTPGDPPSTETVCGLGNRKNELFGRVLTEDGVQPYPGSLALLEQLRAQEMPMAIVSSSRNAPAVLEAAGVVDFFGAVVDGAIAADRGIAGKPAPDTYWAAADELGAERGRAVVVEDAISGVQAGAAGSFGLVLGVDRGVGADALRQAGADLVVADLAELL